MDESELFRLHVGVMAQDPTALVEFEAALRPAVLGLIRRMGLPHEDADEIWNDAFLAAIERAGMIQPLGRGLRAFALSVAHARGVDRLRAAMRRHEAPLDEAKVVSEPRPLGGLDEATARRLAECIEKLPAEHVAIFEMTARGLTAGEVAVGLGKSEANTAKIRQRTRAQLAQCMEE